MKKRGLLDIQGLQILKLCDGNHDIMTISDLVGLAYNTTFFRIQDLEKAKLVILDKTAKGTKPKLKEVGAWADEIRYRIDMYERAKKRLDYLMNKLDTKKAVMEILKEVNSQRFVELDEIIELFIEENNLGDEFDNIKTSLIGTGLIKQRTEITKLGSKFIKDNKY